MTIGLDAVIQSVQEFFAVARQKVNAADPTFLQTFIGIESLTQNFRVAGYQFALQRFRARNLGVQTFELVFDLRSSSFRGTNRGPIRFPGFSFPSARCESTDFRAASRAACRSSGSPRSASNRRKASGPLNTSGTLIP